MIEFNISEETKKTLNSMHEQHIRNTTATVRVFFTKNRLLAFIRSNKYGSKNHIYELGKGKPIYLDDTYRVQELPLLAVRVCSIFYDTSVTGESFPYYLSQTEANKELQINVKDLKYLLKFQELRDMVS